MKPKNFPGRKNKRRLRVFTHRKMSEHLNEDMHNLTMHIIADSTARAIRTKKRRERI